MSEINMAALRSRNRNAEVGNEEVWTLGEELFVGQQFDDKQSALMAIRQYSVRMHQTFKVERSDTKKLIVKCPRYGDSCN